MKNKICFFCGKTDEEISIPYYKGIEIDIYVKDQKVGTILHPIFICTDCFLKLRKKI